MDNKLKKLLFKNFKAVQRGTEFVLKAIPTDNQDFKNFKPKTEMRSLGDLAFHIATLPVGSVILAESSFTEFPPIEVLLKSMTERIGEVTSSNYADIFVRSSKHFVEYFDKKSDDDLINKTYQSFLMRQPATFFEGFQSMMNHLIQHRGTLFAYLRLLDVQVSMKQYFGIKEL